MICNWASRVIVVRHALKIGPQSRSIQRMMKILFGVIDIKKRIEFDGPVEKREDRISRRNDLVVGLWNSCAPLSGPRSYGIEACGSIPQSDGDCLSQMQITTTPQYGPRDQDFFFIQRPPSYH